MVAGLNFIGFRGRGVGFRISRGLFNKIVANAHTILSRVGATDRHVKLIAHMYTGTQIQHTYTQHL